jgi:hypothetical protein
MRALRRTWLGLTAAVLIAAVPLVAHADASPSPIVVSSTVTTHAVTGKFEAVPVPGQVIVTFKNISAQTVKDVVFSVVNTDGGYEVGQIDDIGTFSPNVSIKHVFSNSYDLIDFVEVKLVPIQATFADGTTWKAQAG